MLAQAPQVKGSVPQDCFSLDTNCKSGSPHYPHFCLTCLQIGVPKTPLFRFHSFLYGSQNAGKHFTYYYQFTIKATRQEQPNGRDAYSQAWGRGTGIPFPPVCTTLPEPQWLKLSKLLHLGLYRSSFTLIKPLAISSKLNAQPFSAP